MQFMEGNKLSAHMFGMVLIVLNFGKNAVKSGQRSDVGTSKMASLPLRV